MNTCRSDRVILHGCGSFLCLICSNFSRNSLTKSGTPNK